MPEQNLVPIIVRSADRVSLISLDRLVTLATLIDLRSRLNYDEITRRDVAGTPIADIAGCILWSGWCQSRLAGTAIIPPTLSVDAASYLLERGVRTVAADFPLTEAAADLMLCNNCVLVYCVSNLGKLNKRIVRLVALPLKIEDAFSADARVIAITDA